MRDALPPTVVFDVGERLLLVDGYHRVAAARRGLETIEAEVRRAVSRDALQYAAIGGVTQRGISPDDVASYIKQRSWRRWTSER